MEEDPAPAPAATDASAAVSAATSAASGDEESQPGVQQQQLDMACTPEWATIGSSRYDPLHAVASITLKDLEQQQASKQQSPRQPMDIVCVLDNSGSMSGAKLSHLKHAIRFVESQLGADDRLALVLFNTEASVVHGLHRMNATRKAESEALVNGIKATGCTNILAGMKLGFQILTQRTSRNPIACMFLLTDGQDGQMPAEKRHIAAAMKAQGLGLNVFAFGADHDSAHLSMIARAAESSFVYVESLEEVVDAFGGALGMQQGLGAKNVRMSVTSLTDGVLIDEVNAGDYTVTVAAGRKSAIVLFSSLFIGERRDVVVRMIVPATSPAGLAVPQYPLFELSATYTPVGSDAVCSTSAEQNTWCTVQRQAEATLSSNCPATRDVEVDAHIRRLHVTETLKRALDIGDHSEIASARKLLEAERADVTTNSVAFQAQHKVALQLKADLDAAILGMRSRDHYARAGGRSVMTEACTSSAQQRCTYSKAGTTNTYQCVSSMGMQSTAKASRCTSKNG